MHLLVGLGNPGTKYRLTRHNAGFMVLNNLAREQNIDFKRRKLYSISSFNRKGNKIIIAKPRTYMNLSGNAVQALVHYYHVDMDNLLIIYDDINLPFGKIRVREKGSDGGHNGLQSIIQYLRTNEFPRLRIGIGTEFSHKNMVDFVLSNFSKQELIELDEIIENCTNAIMTYIDDGISKAMNRFN